MVMNIDGLVKGSNPELRRQGPGGGHAGEVLRRTNAHLHALSRSALVSVRV